MTVNCRLRILFLCFAALVLSGCAGQSKPTKSDWEGKVQTVLSQQQGQFQTCGKHLKNRREQVEVSMTFRLNPSGALETLWLNESANWDSRFYDCLFNVVDRMNFPSFEEDTSLEVQQALLFRPKG